MKKLPEKAKTSGTATRLRQMLDRVIDRVRDALTPEPRLQPIPVRVKRRKG